MEEASRFFSKNSNFVIDFENIIFFNEIKEIISLVVKKEKDEYFFDGFKGRKIYFREDDKDFEEGRSSKYLVILMEEVELFDMFDRVLFCFFMKYEVYCIMGLDFDKGAFLLEILEDYKGRLRKSSNNKNMVDLRILLVFCV